ncbi:hypothetical protein J3Q64DRAFT_1761014 [Phycomyces blakesleeanus]
MMMADDVGRFNSEPIMLRHPTSLVEDDKLTNMYKHDQSHHFLLETEDEDGEVIDVPQNLAPEQYRYEFPPRSRIEQLDRYDPNDQYYLDESSFTTTTTTTSTSTAACLTLPNDYDYDDDVEDHESSSSFFYNSISSQTSSQDLDRYLNSDDYIELSGNHHHQQQQQDHDNKTLNVSRSNNSQSDYAYVSWTEADRPTPEYPQKMFVEDGRLSPLQLPAQFKASTQQQQQNHLLLTSSSSSESSLLLSSASAAVQQQLASASSSSASSPLSYSYSSNSFAMSCNERRVREQSYDSTVTVTQQPNQLNQLNQSQHNNYHPQQPQQQQKYPDHFYSSDSPVGPSSFLSGQRRQLFSRLDRVDEEKIHWEDDPFGETDEPLTHWNIKPLCGTHPHQRSLSSPLGSEDSGSNLPVYQSESELYLSDTNSQYTDMDSRSDTTTASKVVVIKLNRANPACHRPSSLTFYGSDEGYYDEDDEYTKEMPIESASVFLPLSEEEQDQLVDDQDYVRVTAATVIQSVWRGYRARQELRSQYHTEGHVKPTHRLMIGIMRMCGTVHRQQMTKMEQRLYDVEQCLREETAMRIEFEKAMEDMTVLVDQQQKALVERLEQEVSVREAYERKFEHAFEQIQPLESRLKQETKARGELESMMKHVIDQVHEMKTSQQQQEAEQARARKALQAQLDEALGQIELLKKPKVLSSSKVLATSTNGSQHVSPRSKVPSTTLLRSATPPQRPKTAMNNNNVLLSSVRAGNAKAGQSARNITRPATSAAIINPRSTVTPRSNNNNNVASLPSPPQLETSARRTRVPTKAPLTTKSTAPVSRRTLISRK